MNRFHWIQFNETDSLNPIHWVNESFLPSTEMILRHVPKRFLRYWVWLSPSCLQLLMALFIAFLFSLLCFYISSLPLSGITFKLILLRSSTIIKWYFHVADCGIGLYPMSSNYKKILSVLQTRKFRKANVHFSIFLCFQEWIAIGHFYTLK